MSDLSILRAQEFTDNLQLLAQQKSSKFAELCMMQQVSGAKKVRMLSQVGSTDAVQRTTSAQPAMDIELGISGRWVDFKQYDWANIVDDIDLLQTNITPQGAFTMNAVAALKRTTDSLFLSAFFGDAQTGETGSATTSFDSNNQVSVSEGAASATGLNVSKMEAAMQILLDGDVDLEFERPIIGISPLQHRNLKELTVVTSGDFNTRRVLGEDGYIRNFNGFDIVVSTLIPTDGDGYFRCPVWVPSGMGRAVWRDITGSIRKRPDIQGNPDYIEATMAQNFTRLEEAKCVEIKCAA